MNGLKLKRIFRIRMSDNGHLFYVEEAITNYDDDNDKNWHIMRVVHSDKEAVIIKNKLEERHL